MRRNIILLILTLHCSQGASNHDGVSQPGILWTHQGNSVQINCTHNKGADYTQMYWYQQRKGESLSLIVFTKSYGEPDFGDSNQSKFGADKRVPESGSLTVKNAQPDDSAMYFCSNHLAERENMSYAHCLCVSVFVLRLAVTILGKSVIQTPSDLLKKENEFAEIKSACFGKTVFQSPGDLIKNQDESAMITCTHNIPSYDRILWYKKDIMGFTFMGYLNLIYDNPELEFKSKIKLNGDGRNNGTLIINTLMLNDSGVYFCAAYDTVLRITCV
ncbi:hypothetical protein Q8A67_019407 [Cirrhinus molitorella]|uniref:Ig-like domain-containing protein n=1 Tax=Cirrhinus molitorella TaxID=172907 RepID=A0AA88PCC1_9TELE|nr:hypothetical protein Q8A67_019407 [Cirrhinus molitorella]